MRRWLIHERHLSVLTAQAREAAIVTITQHQATTASRNARVTRCLKQDPTRLYKDATSSLPDATSSLKRRTRECSFREKTILGCWSTQGRWSSATHTGGSAAWCVQSTRHEKNHHHCRAVHQHESLPKSVLNFLTSLVSRSQEQNDVTARFRNEKLNMRCTCCLLLPRGLQSPPIFHMHLTIVHMCNCFWTSLGKVRASAAFLFWAERVRFPSVIQSYWVGSAIATVTDLPMGALTCAKK